MPFFGEDGNYHNSRRGPRPIEMETEDGKIITNATLRKTWVGQALSTNNAYILDIGKTTHGEVYILCFLPDNKVHHFVTWGFDPETSNCFWGHYISNVHDAVEDLNGRLRGQA